MYSTCLSAPRRGYWDRSFCGLCLPWPATAGFELEVELEGTRELLTELRLAGGCTVLGGAPLWANLEEVLPKEGMEEKEVLRMTLLLTLAVVPLVGGRWERVLVVAIFRKELIPCAEMLRRSTREGVSRNKNNAEDWGQEKVSCLYDFLSMARLYSKIYSRIS